MLKVTRKTKQVEIILDQELAERIAALGDQLSRELTAEQVTEAGTNTAAKRTAKRIEELKEQAKDSTLILTLRAMPVSKWAQTLAANTVTAGNAAGTRDMFGTAADALLQMLESATIGGKPADPADLTKDALRDLFDQLTDGQFTPLWQAIAELNGTAADPKAAFDLASKVLRS